MATGPMRISRNHRWPADLGCRQHLFSACACWGGGLHHLTYPQLQVLQPAKRKIYLLAVVLVAEYTSRQLRPHTHTAIPWPQASSPRQLANQLPRRTYSRRLQALA